MQSGRSVSPCTSGIAWAINPTSSASGSPTFTSSMSAPPSTCCAASVSSCERSPACSCAWKAFRPVGLIRSPMTQNGCSGPMTTVLDRDWTTVSTQLPFVAGRNPEVAAEACDAGLLGKADRVQAGDARQRARMLGELARDVEARSLGVGGELAALDRLARDRDARHVLVHVPQRRRRAHQADRRDERAAVREPLLDRLAHERGEPLGLEADLELEEARARGDFLQRAVDAVVVGRRAGVLDRADEELRRRLELTAGEVC